MIETSIKLSFAKAFLVSFGDEIALDDINIQKTRPEIEGDFTINIFPFVKYAKKSPQETAKILGNEVQKTLPEISSFNVINGFLNFCLSESYWVSKFLIICKTIRYGIKSINPNSNPVLIEYSSPNTNKPLHLGHIRNNLLGFSISEILKAAGINNKKVNLVNDRGIHICKSMLAWERWGDGETPEIAKMKGDHLVGKYYVMFDKMFKAEVKEMVDHGTLEEAAIAQSGLLIDAHKMLLMWENDNEYITKLWIKMNEWVCKGFEATYKRMGVNFDKIYYESDTYLLGKEIVNQGLKDGVLIQKEDGSIWADLTSEGLDQKLLLRADGTSVYMTQDLGTANLRQQDFNPSKMLYVVGNEQNYHFDVLKLVLKKLGFDYWNNITHISYGMVELPEGKMKSREGTVVDADDLMDEMVNTAKEVTQELGKASELELEAQNLLYEQIGLGALKYFILKVDPKKTMMFNPKESIDFNGNTGPFIQYTHARIRSLLAKAEEKSFDFDINLLKINRKETDLIILLSEFPSTVQAAAAQYSPAIIANYVYNLAKEYNQFYHESNVLKEENANLRKFRLQLTLCTGDTIKTSLKLLGIQAPERM
ncbi:MAG: arginine--tRNA ligase [Bacteroidetes bacterium CG2_30_33_31]|nr:MAG: arginine--tRNA ligase [Bacteroidetes bacterium CG2_30_33_31]